MAKLNILLLALFAPLAALAQETGPAVPAVVHTGTEATDIGTALVPGGAGGTAAVDTATVTVISGTETVTEAATTVTDTEAGSGTETGTEEQVATFTTNEVSTATETSTIEGTTITESDTTRTIEPATTVITEEVTNKVVKTGPASESTGFAMPTARVEVGMAAGVGLAMLVAAL